MKIVIAGAGNVGIYLIERLLSEDHEIVVIDLNESLLESLASSYDIQTLQGNASSLDNLRQAGVEDADVFIAATDSDETNLISCMLADSLSLGISKIARVRELVTDNSGLSERIADVFDHFINPDFEAVAILLKLFEVPGAVEVMEFGDGRIWVVGVNVTEDSLVVRKQFKDFPKELIDSGLLIVAIARDEQLIIPSGEDMALPGDEVYVAAEVNRVESVFQMMGREQKPIKSVMISGGTQIGSSLADELSKRGIKVKLIEKDPARCEELASRLDDVLVLQGDGTDQSLLSNEGVSEIDVFVGATVNDEENVLATLLAKKLGARVGAVTIAKSSYLNLVPALGVDIVVSPQIAAASSILTFVREESVSSVVSTRDDKAEALEVIVDEESSLVGVPLRDLKLPSGVIVVAILSEDNVTIPKGDTIVNPGERVIFFANRRVLPKLQRMVKS